MIRAVIFDFYTVWVPDRFAEFRTLAYQKDAETLRKVDKILEDYFFGLGDAEFLAGNLKFTLEQYDIAPEGFEIHSADITPSLIDFMRGLHGHFLKVAVIANMGKPELELVQDINQTHTLFEVVANPMSLGGSLYTPEYYAKALQLLGEAPASCVVVSGDYGYQEFAKSLGMQVVPFSGFAGLQQTLSTLLSGE